MICLQDNSRNKQKGNFSDDDIASAPPFCSSTGEHKHACEEMPVKKEQNGLEVVRSHGSMPTDVGGTLELTNKNDEDDDIKRNTEKQHRFVQVIWLFCPLILSSVGKSNTSSILCLLQKCHGC